MGKQIGSALAVIAVGMLAGCSASTGGTTPGEGTGEASALSYLEGSWACSTQAPDTGDILTLDAVVDGNSIDFTPGAGFGDPVSVSYQATDGVMHFDQGLYIDLPDSAPAAGETMKLEVANADDLVPMTFEVTPQEDGRASVRHQVWADGEVQGDLEYDCTKD